MKIRLNCKILAGEQNRFLPAHICVSSLSRVYGVLDTNHPQRVSAILAGNLNDDSQVLKLAALHHHHSLAELKLILENQKIDQAIIIDVMIIVEASQNLAKFRNYGFEIKHEEDGATLRNLYIKELVEKYPAHKYRIIKLKTALALDTLRNIGQLDSLDPTIANNLKRAVAAEAIFVWGTLAKFHGYPSIYEEISCLAFPEMRPELFKQVSEAIDEKVGPPEVTQARLSALMHKLQDQLTQANPQFAGKIRVLGGEANPDFEEVKRLTDEGYIVIYGNRKIPYEAYKKMKLRSMIGCKTPA